MVVIAPDVATRHGRRWVVLPLSSEADLASNPLAYPLAASATNGLRQASFVMTWLPTTVHADQLQGPLGRRSICRASSPGNPTADTCRRGGSLPAENRPGACSAAGLAWVERLDQGEG